MAEKDVIINDFLSLYFEWNGKFANISTFANEIIQDLPENIQSAHEIMCIENTPHAVFHFVKFCKMMLEGLTTNLEMIRRVQM